MPHRTPNEYMRDLSAKDQERSVAEKIEALLLEGIASGDPIQMDESFWNKRRLALKRRR